MMFSARTFLIPLLLLATILLSPRTSNAQEPIEPLTRFEHLTVADGLANSNVLATLQDSRGFFWFGTENGLSRYDGYTFKTYRHDPNDPNSLINDQVTSIFEADGGTLWLTTGGGVTQYAPDTEVFTPLESDLLVMDGQFFEGFIDSRGDHWFGGGGRTGLIRFRPNADPAFTHYPTIRPNEELNDNHFPARGVQQIVETDDGTLWIAAESRLVAYDPATDQFRSYPLVDGENQLNTFVIGTGNTLWLGAASGLWRFNRATESLERLLETGIEDVHHLEQDGLLWGASPAAGLVAFNTKRGEVVNTFRNRLERPDSIGSGRITSLTVDQLGVLWVGTQSGVSRFDPQHAQFTWYGYTSAEDSTLPHPNVIAIHGHAADEWLVATVTQLVSIDPEQQLVSSIGDASARNLPRATLLQDQNGIIWRDAGANLMRIDPTTQSQQLVEITPPNANARPGRPSQLQVVDMAESADGILWVAVAGGGLLQVDSATNTSTWIATATANLPTLREGVPPPMTTLALGADNSLWLGYGPRVITRYDIAEQTAHHIILDQDNGLSGNFRSSDIYEDVTGIVWLATSNGLLRIDPATDAVERIAALATEDLGSVVGDRGGHLWLGSAHGLLRYRLEDGQVTRFGLDDGLPSISFSERAADIAPDGRLLFGTDNGLVAFYGEQIRPKTTTPTPVLTDLQLFNQSIPLDGTLLSSAVWNSEQITLAHNENSLSFEFAALGYSSHENLRYRYRMNGLDETWTEVNSERRFVTFGQLLPGEYTFEVQSGNRNGGQNGTWNEESTTLAVTIVPAWWQRIAVQAGAVALLIGAISLALWQRSVRLKNRNDELKVLVAEQTHEIADSEARFRGIAAASFEAILVHDAGNIIDANAVAADLFGIATEQLIGRQIGELGLDKRATQQLIDGNEVVWESDVLLPDGRTLILEGRGGSVPYRGHEAQVAALRDVTARREREAERQRLAALEERERIGRDLHDDLGQVMSYLSIQAQTVQQQLGAAQSESVSATLRQLTDVSREAHHNIRRYILGMRSEDAQHEAVNLRNALQLLAQRMSERHQLDVTLTLPPDVAALSLADEVEAQLLRIVQEALTNIVKHANTDRAHLFLTVEEKQVRVVIADEGQGFNQSKSLDGHFGLSIMSERAASVGGTLTVESAENKGTQIVAMLPHLKGIGSAENIRNINTLIVDDHPLYREGLHNLLATRGVNVVGIAANGIEAQTLAEQLQPDLILMDIDMPEQDGLEATRLIHAAQPDIKIIMLTVAANEERLLTALRNGAAGYLLKSLEGDRFFAAIAEVMQGETVLSPAIAAQVLADIAKGEEKNSAETPLVVEFSDRQREVLSLLTSGLTNKEIAGKLFLSVPTVKYHIRKMLELVQLENRHQLVRYAEDNGVLS